MLDVRTLTGTLTTSLLLWLIVDVGLRGGPPQRVWHGTQIHSYRAGDLIVREISSSPSSERPGLVLVWAALKRSTVVVSDVRQFGRPAEIYSRSVPRTALAAINGGFFGYTRAGKHVPLGLVIANGHRQNPLMRWTSGGVLVQEATDRVRLIPIRQYRPLSPPSSALQSKPLLVENGVVAIRGEDSRFNRSAVAITENGTLVLAGAFESFGRALTLKEFATFLVDLKTVDKINIVSALGMDGGPGAHLFFPSLSRHYGDQGSNYVPNLIYLKP